MSFIVEDGTFIENANAYVNIEYVTQYLTERNLNSNWDSLDDAIKKAHIINATDYIEIRFSKFFIGYKFNENQYLSFPRKYYSYEKDLGLLPENLKKACAEYSFAEISGSILGDSKTNLGTLKKQTSKVGPIEDTVEYENSQFKKLSGSLLVSPDYIPVNKKADMLIESLIFKKQNIAIR